MTCRVEDKNEMVNVEQLLGGRALTRGGIRVGGWNRDFSGFL